MNSPRTPSDSPFVGDGAVVESVAADGPAGAAGVKPGFRLVGVNGTVPRDVLDFQFAEYDAHLTLEFVLRGGEVRRLVFDKEEGQTLGIRFRSPVFDGVRRCRNRCAFCFCDQLPPGLRPSLYLRDDDYRLSFLFGNFITLTNLTAADVDRIRRLRLSPLYVSVHAVTPGVRRELFGVRRAENLLPQIDELLACEVELHTQVVLVPGVNDEDELDRTVDELARRRPGVASIALVPVGLTKHMPRARARLLRPVTAAQARSLLARVASWQQRFRAETGTGFVYAADELYLLARAGLPASEEYDDFPQLENGVGLCRVFLDDLAALQPLDALSALRGRRVLVVTGVGAQGLIAGFARRLQAWYGAKVMIAPLRNDWLGSPVTVAGLLGGADVVSQVRPHLPVDIVLLPAACVNESGLLLDDWTPERMATALGVPVVPAGPLPGQAQRQLAAVLTGSSSPC